MSAEILSVISIVAFVLAGICFVFAIYFWFVYKIPNVYADLSGKAVRKSIEEMREHNEKTGKRSFQSGDANKKREKITETFPSDRKKRNERNSSDSINDNSRPKTGLLNENMADLDETNDETDVLYGMEETTVLEDTPKVKVKRKGGKKLNTIEEVMIVHTVEIIDFDIN